MFCLNTSVLMDDTHYSILDDMQPYYFSSSSQNHIGIIIIIQLLCTVTILDWLAICYVDECYLPDDLMLIYVLSTGKRLFNTC